MVEKIIKTFQEFGMNATSKFLDIGSGFGKVVFHVASKTEARCYGYEVVKPRYIEGQEFLEKLLL